MEGGVNRARGKKGNIEFKKKKKFGQKALK